MRITESFRVALDALRANRLRSLLTMLGVVIGVAAVVVLVAIGGGAKQLVTSEVEGLGSNIVFVAPGKFQLGTSPAISRLQLSDADYLNRVLGRPDAVAVSLASGGEPARRDQHVLRDGAGHHGERRRRLRPAGRRGAVRLQGRHRHRAPGDRARPRRRLRAVPRRRPDRPPGVRWAVSSSA